MKRFFKFKYFLALILVVFLGFIFIKSRSNKANFQTEAVKIGEILISTTTSGEIKAEKDVTLQFQTSGLLSWVGVKNGDKVRKGQAIASLDTRDLQKRLKKSLVAYQSQRDDFEQTQADYKSIRDNLLVTDAIKRILDKTQNSLDSSVIDVELYDLAIKFSTIYSPTEGTIVRVDSPYAGVNILPTTATFRIVDQNSVYFESLVDETDVVKIKEGNKVKVKLDAYPDKSFDAVVDKIDFDFSISSGGGTTYKTKIQFSDMSIFLRLGMNGDAEIIQDSITNALLVPLSAIVETSGKTYIWKIEEKKAKRIEVQLGQINDESAQVLSGILEGDKVIITSTSLLKEGMVIKSAN